MESLVWGRLGKQGKFGASRAMPDVTLVQGRFRSEGDEFGSGAPARHVTIGFAPDHAWNNGTQSRQGVPIAFAGQGDAIWATSAERGSMPPRSGHPSQNSQRPSQWEIHLRERGARDRGHSHGREFRRGWLFGGDEVGLFGYPFYGSGYEYGLGFGDGEGLFSECPNWLVPDSEPQGCNADTGLAFPDTAIPGYGADQPYGMGDDYGAPQAETQQISRPYAGPNGYGEVGRRRGRSEAENADGSTAAGRAGGPQQPDTLIYLADGTNYAASSYWLAGGDLHYMTSYGAEDSVPIGQIDLQRTVDENAAQGVQFTLRPAPRAANPGGER